MRVFLLLTILILPASVMAQGSDFPSIGPAGEIIPSWPGRPLTGVPQFGGGKGQGIAAGPLQVTNRAGDTIRVNFVTDWWNLGGVLIGMFSNADLGDMHWSDGRMFQGMCLFTCTFEFTAGTDNVQVWSEYIGCGWCFGAHLDIAAVTSPSPQSVVKQEVKDAARAQAQRANNYGDILNSFAAVAAYKGDAYTATILALGGILEGRYGRWQDGIANDPEDSNGCTWDYWYWRPDYSDAKVDQINNLGYFHNQLVDVSADVDGWMAFAYDMANRQCKDQTTWALINAGLNLWTKATALWTVGDNVDDGDVRQTYRDMAGDAWNYSQVLQSQ